MMCGISALIADLTLAAAASGVLDIYVSLHFGYCYRKRVGTFRSNFVSTYLRQRQSGAYTAQDGDFAQQT